MVPFPTYEAYLAEHADRVELQNFHSYLLEFLRQNQEAKHFFAEGLSGSFSLLSRIF